MYNPIATFYEIAQSLVNFGIQTLLVLAISAAVFFLVKKIVRRKKK